MIFFFMIVKLLCPNTGTKEMPFLQTQPSELGCMKDILFFGGLLSGIVVAVSFLVWGQHLELQERADYYAECEYLGSRMEKGFGTAIFYRWECDGIIEETSRRYES